MTNDERENVLAFVVNESLRRDTALLNAQSYYYSRKDSRACACLYEAHKRKEEFDKFTHDLCVLLHI